jgi:transposase
MSLAQSTAPVASPVAPTATLSPREQRGRQLAAIAKICQSGPVWLVPSQSDDSTYKVDLTGKAPRCSCPDHELRRQKCKHIYAVEYTISRTTTTATTIAPDGTTATATTETMVLTKTVKATYKQNWPAYNAAQTHETARVSELLHGLCQGIVQPPQSMGRPRAALSDMAFSAVFKVYSAKSGRRAVSDLTDLGAKGRMIKTPHYNTTTKYLEDPALTPILKALIEESASPLKAVESCFAADSSGFSTSRFERWYDAQYGKIRSERQWVKVHLMTGVKTNIVTSVEITDSAANDSPYLPPLAKKTAQRFTMDEVSADKGYISNKNLEAIVALNAVPYIPFKVNTTGEGPELWRKMYHYYMFKRDEFLDHYHKRSNVETTFSMIKGKFGDALRSKGTTAQHNEVLCKVLCHNLCCLVASIYELGIEPTFWTEAVTAQES